MLTAVSRNNKKINPIENGRAEKTAYTSSSEVVTVMLMAVAFPIVWEHKVDDVCSIMITFGYVITSGLHIGQYWATHRWVVIFLILYGSLSNLGWTVASHSHLPQNVQTELRIEIRKNDNKSISFSHDVAIVAGSSSSVQPGHWATIQKAHQTINRVCEIASRRTGEFIFNFRLPVRSDFAEEDPASISS